MDGCRIHSEWSLRQQLFVEDCRSRPSVTMNSGFKLNRKHACDRLSNALELKDQVMSTRGQLNFGVPVIFPVDEQLDNLIFP